MHDGMVWRHPTNKQWCILCILAMSVYQDRMPICKTYFMQIIVFVLDLERVFFAEIYVKLYNLVTILSLVTLQGNVCTRAR